MWNISDSYKTYISDRLVRMAHAKIIVDGVTYDGTSTLKTYPSISWQAEFIGSFPAKTCSFEAYKTPGLDLVGKEIEVYRGLEIDGVVEWIPLGLFTATADGVKTSNTANTISYTGYDRAARFDVEYEPLDLTYPITIGAFAQELAFRRGLDFDTTPFPCCDILLEAAPNIPVGTTEREVIRHIAELGGANAWVSRAGALCISQPRETTVQISKRKYTSLSSKEAVFGAINTVVLGKTDYEDDIVYQDAEAVAAHGVIEWRLEDNIFADADREGFAEYIGDSYIMGMSYTPFEVSGCVDDWYLDIGDIIQVQDKNGEYFSTVVLSYNTSGRIQSTIAAAVPGEMLTNYTIAGTTQKKLQYVLLQVDHVNNEIRSIAADVDENNKAVQAELKQTAQEIALTVKKDKIISEINQSAEEIKINADKVNISGLVTFSDLKDEGETIINGSRIDTGSMVIGGWSINDNGLYYGEETSPDLYLGTVAKSAIIDGTIRDNLVFKAGDSFAVCADGCLYASQGEFGGDLTGDVCYFNKLEARDGGTIKIGEWEFLENGLEYATGVFDFEFSGGVAKISGTAPMQVGPFSNGITNTLSLYGTSIFFGVSTSNFIAVMDSGDNYTEITFRPYIANTGNIGTNAYRWDTGHFRNFYVHNIASVANLTASSNVTSETLNVGTAVRCSGTMVIGSASAAQPSKGLKIVSIATAIDSSDYASDKVVTVGNTSGTLYKTGVPLSRLYDVVGTSTAKRKRNIEPLGDSYNIFDALQPIQFNYRNTGEKGLGLLAEDLMELAPDLCFYDDEGEVEGVKYNSIIALLIREVQALKERIDTIDSETCRCS